LQKFQKRVKNKVTKEGRKSENPKKFLTTLSLATSKEEIFGKKLEIKLN